MQIIINEQPDFGYPGCDFCTCPVGYCHKNATMRQVDLDRIREMREEEMSNYITEDD